MRQMKRFAAILTIVLLLAATAPAAMADALYGVIRTPSWDGSVNLRAKAGVSQSVVGWAQNGDEVEILYQGNTWHRVRLLKNGRIGWVYGRYLKATGSVSTGASTGAQVSGTVAQVMTKYPSSKVNLRAGAGTEYATVTRCGRGTRMEIVEQSGSWYKVQIVGSGTTGWMSKTYVSLGLPARATGRVNLRTGAGTSYAVIRTLANGQDVTVTWVGTNWSKVEVNGESGYISNKYYAFR